MERLKNMSLQRAFFLLTFLGLLTAVTLAALLWTGCRWISSQYPLGGVSISPNGTITPLPQPTPEQLRVLSMLNIVSLLGWVVFPVAGLGMAGALFYRWKLTEPIRILMEGTRRIQDHDLSLRSQPPLRMNWDRFAPRLRYAAGTIETTGIMAAAEDATAYAAFAMICEILLPS